VNKYISVLCLCVTESLQPSAQHWIVSILSYHCCCWALVAIIVSDNSFVFCRAFVCLILFLLAILSLIQSGNFHGNDLSYQKLTVGIGYGAAPGAQ